MKSFASIILYCAVFAVIMITGIACNRKIYAEKVNTEVDSAFSSYSSRLIDNKSVSFNSSLNIDSSIYMIKLFTPVVDSTGKVLSTYQSAELTVQNKISKLASTTLLTDKSVSNVDKDVGQLNKTDKTETTIRGNSSFKIYALLIFFCSVFFIYMVFKLKN